MDHLHPNIHEWLSDQLGATFQIHKHAHAHQDEVFQIDTESDRYYLKIAATLNAEHDNLIKLSTFLNVPKVLGYLHSKDEDYLLLSELPGKNLVQLIGEWSNEQIVDTFARAIKQLHGLDARKAFADAGPGDVLLHGDMALPNILVTNSGMFGYLDFGQLSFGPPELDLADAIWSLQRNLGPHYGEIFLEKYGPVTITPKIRKALAFRYQGNQARAQ